MKGNSAVNECLNTANMLVYALNLITFSRWHIACNLHLCRVSKIIRISSKTWNNIGFIFILLRNRWSRHDRVAMKFFYILRKKTTFMLFAAHLEKMSVGDIKVSFPLMSPTKKDFKGIAALYSFFVGVWCTNMKHVLF